MDQTKELLSVPEKITVILLVGGPGTKMGHLTRGRQKLMLEVDGKPVVEHILDEISEAFGSARVIMSTGYRHQDISTYFGQKYQSLTLDYIIDQEIGGTRMGISLAKDLVKTPFLFIGGDVIAHYRQLVQVVQKYEECEQDNLMGVISGAKKHGPAVKHAILSAENDTIIDFDSIPSEKWSADQYRDMHMAYFNPEFFNLLSQSPDDFVNVEQVLSKAVTSGVLFKVSEYQDNWYHFKVPEDFHVKIRFDCSRKGYGYSSRERGVHIE